MAAKYKLREKIFGLARQIPKGRVSTYGALACALGKKELARAVGAALGRNTNPAKTPCHRVVCSDGSIGGYRRGVSKKIALLKKEGVAVKHGRIIDFKNRLFRDFRKLG
jgi:O-6-methylguanine DNA methyltransferase